MSAPPARACRGAPGARGCHDGWNDGRERPGAFPRATLVLALAVSALAACQRDGVDADGDRATTPRATDAGPTARVRPARWAGLERPGAGQALVVTAEAARLLGRAEARALGLLEVDLGDGWAPHIFSESDDPAQPPRPNPYRKTFIDLANDRVDPDDLFHSGATRPLDLSPEAEERRRAHAEAVARARRLGQPPPPEPEARRKRSGAPPRNYLEVFGIPPTLAVLLRRIEEDAGRGCFATLDPSPLRLFAETGATVSYQNARQAQREHDELARQTARLADRTAALGDAAAPDGGLPEAQLVARGQLRLRAIQAAQARLLCEGLLGGRARHSDGVFDRATHEALAQWERKNDLFGWGFLGGETLAALTRPPLDLHFDTFRRILLERLADAAGVIEDGTVSAGKRPATYRDAQGKVHPVPNLVAEHLAALLSALEIATPADMVAFLRRFVRPASAGTAPTTLAVAFAPPPRPPYYAPHMDLEVEIDRGDVWYDFPFDSRGVAAEQKRERYPSLTLLVRWNEQRIPLARWRTTIGSWRSELGADGKVYYKYKSSDVGPRVWKHLVAAPVWVPPDSTPGKDLLTRKTFDLRTGPVTVVNTEVMGPGFQSAYGLVMAIHHQVLPGGRLFDNQIRTHGSVDYTSIARRYSHGCHRLVNTRAVRLFGFVLRHRQFQRLGDASLRIKKVFPAEGQRYGYELTTRGYYYELRPPLPVNVLEGRVLGAVKKPITAYLPKPGVDYGETVGADLLLEPRPVPGP